MVGVAVGPDLAHGALVFVEALHMEHPVHLAHPVGVLVAQVNGDVQLHPEGGLLAGAERAQQAVVPQAAGLVGGGYIDQLLAIVNAHGQLGEEVRHGGHGLVPLAGDIRLILAVLVFELLVIGQGVGGLVVGLDAQVEVDEIAVRGGIGEGDRLGQLIAGHDVLEVIEEIRQGVLAAGLEIKAAGEAPEGDGGRGGGGRRRHAHHDKQHQHEGCDFFE